MKQKFLIGISIINLILLVLSIIINVITFFGIDLQIKFPVIWLLHIGILLVFIPIVVVHSRDTGIFGKINYSLVVEYAPKWMRVLLTIFGIYAVINLGLDMVLSEGGAPDIWDGRYVLHRHGELIRELTLDEYKKQQIYLVRFFSGVWMGLYFNSLVAYYSYLKKEEKVV
jgi:hypothetical protein